MRELLAEKLLRTVLDWSEEELAQEQPIIETLARIKYDEYQQFTPGMKFIESLAFWLNQFKTIDERKTAYNFIRKRLIFFSSYEMNHIVDVTFQSTIRPILLRLVAKEKGIPYWQVTKLVQSEEYKELLTRSLFLGLSDGARIDRFRRTNNNEISNEQILPYYDISDEKIKSIKKDLLKNLSQVRNSGIASPEEETFKVIFLLDDFSGSGISMLRLQDGSYKGKLEKIFRLIQTTLSDANAIDNEGCVVFSIIYVMTKQAKEYLDELIKDFWDCKNSRCEITPVMQLQEEVIFGKCDIDKAMMPILNEYYDPDVFNEHLQKGGTADVKLGFAGCGLPLILSHNTPNDSLYILWGYHNKIFRGLFPRVTRHKEN